MEKYFFTYEDIHKTSKDIARRVEATGFAPDVIVAIGSGGFIPARIMRTFLCKPILAVGVAYYDADDKPCGLPRKVQWIEEAEKKLAGRRILLVDEVDDSRTTLEYCVRELLRHNPEEIAVAVLHNKNKASVSVKRGSREKSAPLATEIAVRDSRSCSRPWPLSWDSWLTGATWFKSWA